MKIDYRTPPGKSTGNLYPSSARACTAACAPCTSARLQGDPPGYYSDTTGKLFPIQKSSPEQIRRKAHLGIVRISVTNPHPSTPCKVRICPHGSIIAEGGHVRTKPSQSGATRGVIKGWSRQSRARLRRLLAEADGPEGWEPLGMTGTIPGNVVSESDFRRLWQSFRRHFPEIPAVWRVELQKRKQPHVHIVTWIPSDTKGYKKISLLEGWFKAVRRLGKVEWKGKDGTVFQSSRMALPGAVEHAVCLDTLEPGDDFGWWRYIASHAGKSKQDQLGWKGRNWGTLNDHLLRRHGGEKYDLTEKQWYKMRRWLRRLTGYHGAGAGTKSVWYVRPDTQREMVKLARSVA